MAAQLEDPRHTKSRGCVVIMGRLSMQDWLVAGLLREELGCSCQVRGLYLSGMSAVAHDAIALIDIDGLSSGRVAGSLPAWRESGPYRCIAFLNAEEASVAELAYLPGVRGVFAGRTSHEHLLKGVRALMAGEYWLPRRFLVAHFERTRPRPTRPRQAELTQKETQTLRLLTGGYSNGAIARELGVSSHTVKTHVYNLSRKIGVHNRVQAAKWAMENLGEPCDDAERYAGGLELARRGALPAPAGE